MGNFPVLVCFFFLSVLAETEEAASEEESEPMLGSLDYALLLAIAAIGYWWFFKRDNESDKIPEVRTSLIEFRYFENISVRDKAYGRERDEHC